VLLDRQQEERGRGNHDLYESQDSRGMKEQGGRSRKSFRFLAYQVYGCVRTSIAIELCAVQAGDQALETLESPVHLEVA
jgi:hypothetical protein